MRLITCDYQQRQHLGILHREGVILPALTGDWPGTMLALIDAGSETWSKLAREVDRFPDAARVSLSEVRLLAPIPRPRQNVMCLGLNYVDHAEESFAAQGREAKIPEHPVVFTKAVSSVTGPYDPIPYDADVSTQMDWEVELAVVIGHGGRKIPVQDALNHVFGYTVINDISARNLQFRHKQFFLGKSLDGACPMGPCIATADEIPDPQALDLHTWVNGTLKQSSNTGRQVFPVADVISILSQGMTLQPGAIIATGTPSGVGFARQPPEFLKPGDVVECEVETIGRLRNPVLARDKG